MKLEKLVEVIPQQFVNLNTLHLNIIEDFAEDGLCSLSTLPNLTYLSWIAVDSIADVRVSHLGVLQCLRGLSLKWCWHLTDVGIKELASLTALTKLELYECPESTKECLACLATLTLLRDLRLRASKKITDVGV